MLRPLYNWAMGLAAGPYALPAMAGVALIEATLPFVPPDVMLAPMVLARRERAWLYAGVCTVFSVLGGCIGYAIGYLAAPAALKVLALAGHPDALQAFQCVFAQWGAAVILIKGVTPVPYMVVTLASGLARFSLPVFIGASLITRGGRFFLVAALLQHPRAKAFIDKYLTLLVVLAVVALIAALFVLRGLESHHGC
jgi:membrane protein YqaA with SNARE-associated domain